MRPVIPRLGKLQAWFQRPAGNQPLLPVITSRLGVAWVAVSLPFITAVSAFVDSPNSYVFVLIFMAAGAYTTPALVAGWVAVRNSPPRDRLCYALLYAGLATCYVIGLAMVGGLFTGWRWANSAGPIAVLTSGLIHLAGLLALVRSRSGRRALSVDLLEAVIATIAVTAPLIVLWGPAVIEAEASWFTIPAAVATVCGIAGAAIGSMLIVRLGPGRGAFEASSMGLVCVGVLNGAMQTVQGVSGFSLPAPPLIALSGICFSMYLLIPLNVPLLLRQGLDRLPPQSQVRGTRIPMAVSLVGLGVLLVATLAVDHERPWAVPFSLGVVSLLFVLGGLRHMASAQESRRLYRKVEQAAGERQALLAQLLERSAQDRRDFAGQLYQQAAAAYASFRMLAGTDQIPLDASSRLAAASERVGGDFARQAESVRDLVMAIRPLDGNRHGPDRLGIPIRAYLASIYGDQTAPQLQLHVADELSADWVTETLLLQIVQEALQNVCQHSQATSVDVSIEAADAALAIVVTDNGVGFDLDSVAEGPGMATIRAAAAVNGGRVLIETAPGAGTKLTAALGPANTRTPPPPEPPRPPLRLVRG